MKRWCELYPEPFLFVFGGGRRLKYWMIGLVSFGFLGIVGGGFGGLDRSRLNPVKWLPLVKNGLSVKTVSLRFPV
ncbi:hypothetical protein F2Q68_00045155 [Brassica cretica]|uniref:Uncharacterized protein n=1 Tax=Brassica cretica TaxID=69181 RepID=A0A8S9LNH9_BRACR|nr:hypothetical protein F2Q68_00045155 [Brassica cretica]